jgi:hypothetical protein
MEVMVNQQLKGVKPRWKGIKEQQSVRYAPAPDSDIEINFSDF